MNRLSVERRAQIIRCLVEGNSIRSTVRITGAAKNTVTKLLVDVGQVCAEYQKEHLRCLPCENLQVDEIWAFCGAKQRNVPKHRRREFGVGDVWTFTAICADTKLVPCWRVGWRDLYTATLFLQDLYSRLDGRVQLTTDGLKLYITAVDNAFGTDVDFAQLVKIYGQTSEGQRRYSPPELIETIKTPIHGNPKLKKINTSYVERMNLTFRTNNRRYTRLTNAFSKKVDNLEHSIALHMMHYNFARIHRSLRVSPAMEAGVSDRLWGTTDIARLAE